MSLYYEGASLLHRLTPLTKIVVTLIAMFHMVLFPQLKYILLHLMAATALLVTARPRIPIRVWAGALAVVVGHGWINAVMVRSGSLLLDLGWLKVYWEGLELGITLAARVMAIILYSILVAATTNPRDLAVSIAKLGVDYRYAFAAYVTFRMAPLVRRDLENVLMSRKIRGVKTRVNPIELMASILAPLLSLVVRRSTLLSISMESRAFGALRSRAYYWDVQSGVRDYAFLAAFLTYLIVGTCLLTYVNYP
ncbi:MAG: hypothetical protein DRJ57_00540 [Thermoprotei archaeon]|nr:MAG: hypothetical protein DRJ57_00540 [Thermoprotei archaeon]